MSEAQSDGFVHVVINSKGEYFTSRRFDVYNQQSTIRVPWTTDIRRAKIYPKIGTAKGVGKRMLRWLPSTVTISVQSFKLIPELNPIVIGTGNLLPATKERTV